VYEIMLLLLPVSSVVVFLLLLECSPTNNSINIALQRWLQSCMSNLSMSNAAVHSFIHLFRARQSKHEDSHI
jgi:hypothetical protein